DRTMGPSGGGGEPRIERGMYARKVQRHRFAGVLRGRAGDGVDLRLAPLPQVVGKVGLRLDQDPGPTHLFEMERLRPSLRVVGADIDEISAAGTAEEFLLQGIFVFIRKDGS